MNCKRSIEWFRLLLVSLFFLVGLGFVSCAQPRFQDFPKNCTITSECPGSKVCRGGVCVSSRAPEAAADASDKKEPKGEATPEKKAEPVKEDKPEARPEPVKEDKPEEKPEEQTKCKEGEKRSCKNKCHSGNEECRDGKWSNCSAQTPGKEECNNVDDDCNGKIDDGLKRKCKNSCGDGNEICSKGKWGSCDARTPKKEECNNVDDDCNGKIDDGLTKTCYTGSSGTENKGECKSGTRTCVSGSWGACVGEVVPVTEKCGDGKDNDCDGYVDESDAGCQCRTGQTQGCGSDTGSCQKGKQTCSSQGKWGACVGEIKPAPEKCNGKDDDCDGKVDEIYVNLGQTCSKGLGICKATGKYKCNTTGSGTTCDAVEGKPAPTELCRDKKDNDCDGKVDEICGPSSVPWVVLNGRTTQKHSYISVAARSSIGLYKVTVNNSRFGCGSAPLIVSAISSGGRQPVSFNCSSTSYAVSMGKSSTGSPVDGSFSAVLPSKVSGEAWGFVPISNCSSRIPYPCTHQYQPWGGAKVSKLGTGLFKVSSTLCSSSARPYFATIYDKSPSGYINMHYAGRGACYVRTYSLSGKPADRSFVYWIPNPSLYAWSVVGASNGKATIYGQNNFSDQKARWSAVLNRSSMCVNFPAWNGLTTAALVGNSSSSSDSTSYSLCSKGASVYSRSISSGAIRFPLYMSVLFLP